MSRRSTDHGAAMRVDEDAQDTRPGCGRVSLDDYIGQDRVRENLQVSIAAARQRGEALDHVLVYGPARSRQDDARLRHRQRDGRRHPLDVGTRAREARRPRRPS